MSFSLAELIMIMTPYMGRLLYNAGHILKITILVTERAMGTRCVIFWLTSPFLNYIHVYTIIWNYVKQIQRSCF